MHSHTHQARWHLRRALVHLAKMPCDPASTFHSPPAATSSVEDALAYLTQGKDARKQVSVETPVLVGAWTFEMQQRVVYTPYARADTHPECHPATDCRIVGRTYTEIVEMRPSEQYVIQPWELSGHWVHDRPLVVFVNQLAPFQEADAPSHHGEGERKEQRIAEQDLTQRQEAFAVRRAVCKAMHSEITSLREENTGLRQRLNDLRQDVHECQHATLRTAAAEVVRYVTDPGVCNVSPLLRALCDRLNAALRAGEEQE